MLRIHGLILGFDSLNVPASAVGNSVFAACVKCTDKGELLLLIAVLQEGCKGLTVIVTVLSDMKVFHISTVLGCMEFAKLY